MAMNSVNFMGRLTKDPEIRQTNSGKSVANFSVAVDGAKDKNGNSTATFVDCTAWNGTADILGKYFSKGRMIAISGRLANHSWTGNDNKSHTKLIIIADAVFFADSGKSERAQSNSNTGFNQSANAGFNQAANTGFTQQQPQAVPNMGYNQQQRQATGFVPQPQAAPNAGYGQQYSNDGALPFDDFQ